MRFWLVRKLLKWEEQQELKNALYGHHIWLINEIRQYQLDSSQPTPEINAHCQKGYRKQEEITHSLIIEMEK